jgi:hypothetical protein
MIFRSPLIFLRDDKLLERRSFLLRRAAHFHRDNAHCGEYAYSSNCRPRGVISSNNSGPKELRNCNNVRQQPEF